MNDIRSPHIFLLVVLAFLAGCLASGFLFSRSITDVNWDGTVNVLDVQLVVNDFLGGEK